MFGRKARKIEELEEEIWKLKDENFNLKMKLKKWEAPTTRSREDQAKRYNPASTPSRKRTGSFVKPATRVVQTREVVREKDDSGPGFVTGLMAGAILNDLLGGDHNNNSSEPEPFSGGGGDFGGGGASADWGGGSDSGGGGSSE